MQTTLILDTFDIIDNISDFSNIYNIDKALWQNGISKFIGVDEAGRGPLAGPVVAAAVVLNPEIVISGVDDSKKLTEKRREQLNEIIRKNALAVGVGIVQSSRIDEINILRATFEAMTKAVNGLEDCSKLPLLVDGRDIIPGLCNQQKSLVKGDAKCASIAAASIIAKVARDDILISFNKKFPEYGFDRHKGYATKEHIKAIQKHGLCTVHRSSFKVKSLV
ncbi:MAG: ribonuclease HII [bacterium]